MKDAVKQLAATIHFHAVFFIFALWSSALVTVALICVTMKVIITETIDLLHPSSSDCVVGLVLQDNLISVVKEYEIA